MVFGNPESTQVSGDDQNENRPTLYNCDTSFLFVDGATGIEVASVRNSYRGLVLGTLLSHDRFAGFDLDFGQSQ